MLLVHWFNQLNSQSEWIISLVWSAADSTRPIGQKVANKGRLVPIIRDKLQQLTTNAHWWPWCKPVTDTGVYCIIYKQITIETIHIVKPECYSVDQHTPPSCHRVDSLMLPLRKKKKKKDTYNCHCPHICTRPSRSMDVTTKCHTRSQTEIVLRHCPVSSQLLCSNLLWLDEVTLYRCLKLLTNSRNFPSKSSAIFFHKFFLSSCGRFSLSLLAALPTTTTGVTAPFVGVGKLSDNVQKKGRNERRVPTEGRWGSCQPCPLHIICTCVLCMSATCVSRAHADAFFIEDPCWFQSAQTSSFAVHTVQHISL